MNDPKVFWAKVSVGKPGECWPWRAARGNGYGIYEWDGRNRTAHAVAFELANDVVLVRRGQPGYLEVDHTCHDPDNCQSPCSHRACCNPAHLEAVTKAENNLRRLRSRCSERHLLLGDNLYVGAKGERMCRSCLGYKGPRKLASHGTVSMYKRRRCRCAECREAVRISRNRENAARRLRTVS